MKSLLCRFVRINNRYVADRATDSTETPIIDAHNNPWRIEKQMVVCFLLARNEWIGSHYSPVRITDVTTITHHNNPRALHCPTLHPTLFASPSPSPSSSQAPFFVKTFSVFFTE